MRRWLSSEIGAGWGRHGRRRAQAARKATARRAALERLEERALMAVLPAPTVVSPVNISSQVGLGSLTSNESAPSIAIDQNNPDHMVAVWTRHETNVSQPPFIDVEGAYTIDGGQTWRTFNPSNFLLNPNTTGPTVPYTRVTDASVAFDRQGHFYVLTRHTTADTAGALALSRFTFPSTDPAAVPSNDYRDRIVYQWIPTSDQAVQPMLAVDDSPAVFTDPDTGVTQNDPYSGNIYIAFATVDTTPAGNPLGADFNPNRIRLIASSDGGTTFGGQSVINDSGNFGRQRNARPRLSISHGGVNPQTGTAIPAGQVTVVWDDFGTGADGSPSFDIIWSDRLAAASAYTTPAVGGAVTDNGVTDIPITVDITDPRFGTLDDLNVSLSLIHPNIEQLRIELVPPVGSGLSTVTLVNTGAAGTGANFGILNGFNVPTVFDSQAARSIVDIDPATGNRGAAAPFIGSFRPQGSLNAFNGATVGQLNGIWTLRITDNTANAGAVQAVQAVRLSLTDGLNDAYGGPTSTGGRGGTDQVVASTLVRGAIGDTFSRVTAATAKGIGPNPVIAVDNTLGSFSAFAGRLYVAYVDWTNDPANQPDNTDIRLSYSDDGGRNWFPLGVVNDDDARRDGFSEADRTSGVPSGRPQFQPNLVVDQSTGTLVASWYDTRHDASEARVATYLGTSIDGGQSFSQQVFANNARIAIDAITGQPVNLGPIPDNQSAGNPNTEATFNFGDRQGLVAYQGHAYPIWASNLNGDSSVNDANNDGLNNNSAGVDDRARLDIRVGQVTYGAGPRVVASTMGPIGLTDQFGNPIDPINNTRTSDGTPILSGFDVTFDRPIDPDTFRPDAVRVFFRDTTPGNVSGGPVPVVDVLPQSSAANDPDIDYNPGNTLGYTRFRVIVAPRSAVGTYSYTIGPVISDRVRHDENGTIVPGNRMDQDADARHGEPAQPGVGVGDVYAAPRPTSTGGGFQLASNGFFAGPYDDFSLPLILAGPHVISSRVPGAPISGDNLARNRPVTGLDITFDREMTVQSFTGNDVLRIQGPAGELITPRTFTPPAGQLNQPIPDDPANPLRSTLVITDDGGFRVGDLNVSLTINHTRDSDLTAVLVAPDGTRITLFSGIGGTGANFTGTVLDDEAATPINTAGAPFTGLFRPASPLSALDGKELRGTWTLEVTDGSSGETGSLVSWSMAATPMPRVAAAYNASSGSLAIPDTGAAVLMPLIVPDDGGVFQIADLNVSLDITHPRPTDLAVDLMAPDGTIVPLFANIGGQLNGNVRGLTLDDQAGVPVNNVPAPFTGVYRPQLGALSALDNKPLRGTWNLVVRDTAGGQTGTLNSWSLTAVPTSSVATARTFRISFPTQIASGDYGLSISPSLLSRNGDAVDTDQNAGLSLLRGTAAAAPTVAVSYDSADVGKPLGDVTTTSSVLVVPDSFLIADANLTLDITHPNDPDLSAVLVAPDGTRIVLFANEGNVPGNRANFTHTTFDDQADTLIQNGSAPFFGTFKPRGTGGLTLSSLNGKNASGVWTLEITDSTPGNTGTLNSWSLTFQRPVPNSGLGEPTADRAAVGFRISTLDALNPLSSNIWTPVGPAAIANPDPITGQPTTRNGMTGRISAVAVDPSDPSGNTVYIGAAAGGVWKTTNFLTTDPDGPTWIPLTDFGPTFSLNIGSIAIFARNNDPNQSIIFAATGEGAGQYGWGSTGGANAPGSTTRGVGFLRSTDGGATWTLLDSTDNSLPFNQRNHLFAQAGGSTAFRVVADPTATPTGDVIVYAALSGPNGGLWRSLDTGATWQNMRAGNATDVVLDLNSKSVSTGNVDIIHAAFAGDGVYISPNRGQTFNAMTGQVGVPQLRDSDAGGSPAIGVTNLPSPNGGFGRIVLAKPEPLDATATSAATRNLLYEGWLYAAVANTDGTFHGLYQTKDNGQTWTQIQLPNVPWPYAGRPARASNDPTRPDYDVIASPTFVTGQYNIALTVDPNDPNVVFLGGTSVGQQSGLIRVDATAVRDAHMMVGYQDDLPGGGARTIDSRAGGAISVENNDFGLPAINIRQNSGLFTFDTNRRQFVGLLQDPDQPFAVGSTVYIFNASPFANDGAGAKWTPADAMLFASDFDSRPSTNIHQLVSFRDPLTGVVRLIAADDQGIYSGVGPRAEQGIGTAAQPANSRVGNLQTALLYRGAAQPSTLAAQTAGAMFYGMSQGTGYPQSDPDILTSGDPAWSRQVTVDPIFGVVLDGSGELDGSDVATDQQGRGLVYQYKWPGLSNDASFTNFFQVNGVSRTRGLLQSPNDSQWPLTGPVYGGLITMGRFTVNPLNGDQIVISSNAGRIFGTTNQGAQWQVIGNPGDLDGSYAPALTYGAPDPAAPGGIGNLGNFIYAGTIGGRIFVTRTGGGGAANAWQNISGGLDGSSVVEIVASPDRGSHAAYAVTLNAVYFNRDTLAPGSSWQNISGNLFSIQQAAFGDATANQTKLSFLTAIKADWRYAIPDDFANPTGANHPVLYVSGDAGVYRSFDNGQSWTLFPAAIDGAPVDGGFLPSVAVTDLDLSLGRIDPTNGRPIIDATSPNVLLASTFGRGSFAVRLAPQIFGQALQFAPGSDSGASSTDRITNVVTPTFQGLSAQTAFGAVVTVNLIDLTDPANPVIIGTATTDATGRFSITVNPGHFLSDGSTDGVKIIGAQATDQSGAKGNMALFVFTLDTIAPNAPGTPDLQPGSDSGLSDSDNVTSIVTPVFDVSSSEPVSTVLTLLRDNQPIATRGGGGAIADPGAPINPGVPTTQHTYQARQEDLAGNVSAPSGALVVTFDTQAPSQPAAPQLNPQAADDTGVIGDNITSNAQPHLIGTVEPGSAIVRLVDLAGNVIGTATAAVDGSYIIQPDSPFPADGVYDLRVVAVDSAGNVSLPSPTLRLTINSRAPGAPTLAMVRADDSGSNTTDNVTNNRRPRFTGDTSAAGLAVELLDVTDPAKSVILGTTITAADRTYLVQPDNLFPTGTRVYMLQTRVRDNAGNTALSNTLQVTIDTTPPGAVPTLILQPQDDTGILGDNKTVRRQPHFIGTTEPGASVEIIRTDDGSNAVVSPPNVRADANGNFTVQLARNLVNGSIVLQARVRDDAGNVGSLSAPLRVTIVSASDDFDTDGRSDPTAWRPTGGVWSIAQSTGARRFELLGQPGDIPVRGDFDGDGKADIGVYRTTTGQFLINRSTAGPLTLSFGNGPTSLPVTADYDGDGKTDIAVFDTQMAYWFVIRSSLGPVALQFGRPGGDDTPLVGDFNNDGRADIAVFWADQALFLAANTGSDGKLAGGFAQVRQFGRPGGGDVPLVGDFNGDGRSDIGAYWADRALFLYSYTGSDDRFGTGGAQVRSFGRISADVPVLDDYDGDGKTDTAVYWPDTGQFLISYSAGGGLVSTPGIARDLPLQAPVKYLKANSRAGATSGGTVVTAAFAPAAAAGSLNFGQTAAGLSTASPAAAAKSQAPSTPPASRVVTRQGDSSSHALSRAQRLAAARLRRFIAQHRAGHRQRD